MSSGRKRKSNLISLDAVPEQSRVFPSSRSVAKVVDYELDCPIVKKPRILNALSEDLLVRIDALSIECDALASGSIEYLNYKKSSCRIFDFGEQYGKGFLYTKEGVEDAARHIIWTGFLDSFAIGLDLSIKETVVSIVNSTSSIAQSSEIVWMLSAAIEQNQRIDFFLPHYTVLNLNEVFLKRRGVIEGRRHKRSQEMVPNEMFIRASVGSVSLTEEEFNQLKAGDILVLNETAWSQIQLIVGDEIVGEGSVVVADDHLGIRITKTRKKD